MFRLNKRGGLTVDREALHASPGYKRQIEALAKLHERGDEMSAILNKDDDAEWPEHSRISCSDEHPVNATVEGNGCHRCNAIFFAAHAQMVEKVRDVIAHLRGGSAISDFDLSVMLEEAIGDAK